jgi:hypothetical protein
MKIFWIDYREKELPLVSRTSSELETGHYFFTHKDRDGHCKLENLLEELAEQLTKWGIDWHRPMNRFRPLCLGPIMHNPAFPPAIKVWTAELLRSLGFEVKREESV